VTYTIDKIMQPSPRKIKRIDAHFTITGCSRQAARVKARALESRRQSALAAASGDDTRRCNNRNSAEQRQLVETAGWLRPVLFAVLFCLNLFTTT
jgi:hypothetical protein